MIFIKILVKITWNCLDLYVSNTNILKKIKSQSIKSEYKHACCNNRCFWLTDLKKILSSKTNRPNGTNISSKHLWHVCGVLHKVYLLHPIWSANKAAIGNFLYLIVLLKKISETTWLNGSKNLQESSIEGPVQCFLNLLWSDQNMASAGNSC